MPRSLVLSLSFAALLVPAPSSACIPPMAEFRFGSTQLSDEGRKEIAVISRRALANGDTRVVLTATTDRSKLNLKMAQRRVAVIKAELAKRGVSEGRIDVEYVNAASDASARLVILEIVSAPNCGS